MLHFAYLRFVPTPACELATNLLERCLCLAKISVHVTQVIFRTDKLSCNCRVCQPNEGVEAIASARAMHGPQGFLSVNLNSTYYELAQRHAEVPRLSAQQREALAAVGALALGDELRLDFVLQPGDLQLLSNFTQLHTRSAFLDPEARSP